MQESRLATSGEGKASRQTSKQVPMPVAQCTRFLPDSAGYEDTWQCVSRATCGKAVGILYT